MINSSHESYLLIFQTWIIIVRKGCRRIISYFKIFRLEWKFAINDERNEFSKPNQPNVTKDDYDGLDRWNPLMLEESSVGERGNHTNHN